MLPSILTHEIRESTRRFLIGAYEPSDAFFHGVVRRFVEADDGLAKGPYLQLGLPFRPGSVGLDFFRGFRLPFPGHRHQEAAWERLASDRGAANTLVATGTGSGKTECFLFPVLDHCARARLDGQGGIKALVIYPMNALAADQARRFAETVASTPEFRALRVGMYVGGGNGKAGGGTVMTPESVITDRETLRKAPPDVLLTNYKMLDYLLIRPKDRALWAENGPETLRYVVVDELHTFDGAQGTDLAMLLRRLCARLGTPKGALICAGTSATLGDGDTSPLREYAGQVFGGEFPPESVVTETRDSVGEFLGERSVEHVLQDRPDFDSVLDAARYRGQSEAITAWFPVFFDGQRTPDDVNERGWRVRLGELLKEHLLFHKLLRACDGKVMSWQELSERLSGPMPVGARRHVAKVLDAFLALVAWARSPGGRDPPLVTLRVQLWMRELRRLVASVCADSERVVLRWSADLKTSQMGVHLPLVQCSECHTTGWLARRPASTAKLDADLEHIYNAWFQGAADICRLYPAEALEEPRISARRVQLCGYCGALQVAAERCGACGATAPVPVWEMLETGQSTREGVVHRWHCKDCPACGAEDRLLLVGARNATLAAQMIEQSWATPFNDDKKLIAFSDSVQDAALRAGFFGSRTYANNVRMAMAQVLAHAGVTSFPWFEYLSFVSSCWLNGDGPRRMSPETFVAEFIGPNMTWQREWTALQEDGALPSGSQLQERVRKRLSWQAVADFTYLSRRGRTLDRLGMATLTLPVAEVDQHVSVIAERLREDLGLRQLSERMVLQWVWGWLIHLRQRGAVTHPEMTGYAQQGGVFGFLSRPDRELWLPPMTGFGPHPKFLTLGKHRDFDRLEHVQGSSWYQRWLLVCLGAGGQLLPPHIAVPAYEVVIDVLVAAGLLSAFDGQSGRSIGLNGERMYLRSETAWLCSRRGDRTLTVDRSLAERLVGMPCLDAMDQRYEDVREPDGATEWMVRRFREGDIRRVIPAEHTGLLERDVREALELRFKAKPHETKPWFENLLSATPTLEMGVDIGNLSSVLLCSVPPSQASFLQRVGRAGRRDGNAVVVTLADGASPHDLYFHAEPLEMMVGEVTPPGVFLQAAEVLRRQLMAFCIDAWVATGVPDSALPEKTGPVLDAVERREPSRFPYTFIAFVQAEGISLLERFKDLLGASLVERVSRRLDDHMFGEGESDGLRMGLIKLLEGLAIERAAHRGKAKELKQRVQRLRQQPSDEALEAQVGELTRERDKALELARELGARDLLGTLTDAGLIPNYAFPEAGVELKSIFWRRRTDGEHGEGKYITLPAERYERPASSALSEFAPENRFYANRRRVEIDQVNMQLAKVERWRLCPSCHHAECIELTADANPACPRCGDGLWANVSQLRNLLRFRQAMANANDARSRIDDSTDDREPRFFIRQMLVDFAPDDIEIAWKLESEQLTFGFEFIRSATFRDINFGERGRAGDSFKVADLESARPGFRLCRHCGMVQKPVRRRREGEDEPAQNHSRDCTHFGGNDPGSIVDCLYLYREFASEALRILVPYTPAGMDDTILQSFMAALQLGLKRRFGGKVDHLRITSQEEPGREGGPRRHYVLVYDSVPGGTGYLHQLLSQEAETLTEVLAQAHQAMTTCRCNEDPEKDGCYRCVYQYRLGRSMAQVSRRAGVDLLRELVAVMDRLERVRSVSHIAINPKFDSVLEGRFVEALRRLGGAKGIPVVRVLQEVIDGKSAYLLEVGNERYWMRLQVDLLADAAKGCASKPDFLISPVRETSPRRSIAVFTDGWSFHHDCLREDARKRSALVACGRYWTWSVTWEDVEAALRGAVSTDLDLLEDHGRLDANHPLVQAAAARLGASPSWPVENAVAELLRWLATPVGTDGEDRGTKARMRSVAVMASRLVLAPGATDRLAADALFQRAVSGLPDAAGSVPASAARCASRDVGGTVKAVLAWPNTWLAGDMSAGCGGVLLEPALAPDPDALKQAWRQWLALYNALQLLPRTFLIEVSGLDHGDYLSMTALPPRADRPLPSATGEDTAWDVALGAVIGELSEGLGRLRNFGVPAPDVIGLEAATDSGRVSLEAELAWTRIRLVVLACHQLEQSDAWIGERWNVVGADSDDWPERVTSRMRELQIA